MHDPFLIGQRVSLRVLEPADAPLIVSWLQDAEVTQTLGAFFAPADVETEADGIERLYRAGHDLLLGIVLKTDERLIGAIELAELDLDNHHCSLGLFIGDRREWGNGYGAEAVELMLSHAFLTLRMNRVWLHVDEHNARALRSYEKLGFQREGLLRQDRYSDGRYVNTVAMALLREEWEAARAERNRRA